MGARFGESEEFIGRVRGDECICENLVCDWDGEGR